MTSMKRPLRIGAVVANMFALLDSLLSAEKASTGVGLELFGCRKPAVAEDEEKSEEVEEESVGTFWLPPVVESLTALPINVETSKI